MAQDAIAYQWVCPICGIKRISLTRHGRTTVESQAENAIRSHVTHTSGSGHGEEGEFPPGFDPSDVVEHVRFQVGFGGRTTP